MPAIPALTKAVNHAIANGGPLFINMPAADLRGMPTLDVLANGGHVKARRPLPDKPFNKPAEIVVCHLPDNRSTPYATWQRNVDDGGCYWGHYFGSAESVAAWNDFSARGN